MVPLRLFQELPSDGVRQSPSFDPVTMDIINHLRMVALDCRSAARADLFEACALLSHNPDVAKTAHAEALMKCLSQTLGKAPKMLRPGVVETSFDEAWLARLSLAARNDDDASLTFLLRSRVPLHACRNVAFLIRAISDNFSLN